MLTSAISNKRRQKRKEMIKGMGTHWSKALRNVLPGVSSVPLCPALAHRMAHLKRGSNHTGPAGNTLRAADQIKAEHLRLVPAGLKEPALVPLASVFWLPNVPPRIPDRP